VSTTVLAAVERHSGIAASFQSHLCQDLKMEAKDYVLVAEDLFGTYLPGYTLSMEDMFSLLKLDTVSELAAYLEVKLEGAQLDPDDDFRFNFDDEDLK
jgi:hypothetical protein